VAISGRQFPTVAKQRRQMAPEVTTGGQRQCFGSFAFVLLLSHSWRMYLSSCCSLDGILCGWASSRGHVGCIPSAHSHTHTHFLHTLHTPPHTCRHTQTHSLRHTQLFRSKTERLFGDMLILCHQFCNSFTRFSFDSILLSDLMKLNENFGNRSLRSTVKDWQWQRF